MIHIVTSWDTESPCRTLFARQVCFQRDWCDASNLVMDVCEKFNVPATFMVNVGEIDYWRNESPNAEDIIRRMYARGHDVQLHLHTAWAFWWCDGKEPYYNPQLDVLDDGIRRFPAGEPDRPWTQRFFIRQGIDRLKKITGVAPVCYRDVHYDVNDPRVFYSLWKEGIKSDWTMQKGCISNLSQGLAAELASADPLPVNAYWPDFIEPRMPVENYGWPVLEVPATVLPGTLNRFDFQLPVEKLIRGFDQWCKAVADESVAICVFLNHQKREIFDADNHEKPWKNAGKNILENMRQFFEYVQEGYISKNLPVKFSKASDAAEDFIDNIPKPKIINVD